MPTANLTASPMLNGVLTAIMLGLMGWTLLTVHELTNKVSIINNTLQLTSQNIYPRAVAEGELKLINQRINRLEQWNQNLSERVRGLEDEE